jgi:hypothetical protein
MPAPEDINVTVIDVTPEIQAVVAPASTVHVVTEPPEIIVVGSAILGPQGPQGPPGGTIISGNWDYGIATTAPPLPGQIRTAPDPTVVGQPMTIYISATDDNGLYWQSNQVNAGDEIILRGSAGAVQRCEVTSFAITVPGSGGYATIQAIATSVQGQIAKNAVVEVSLVHPPGTTGPFYGGHTYAVLGNLDGITTLPSFFVPKHELQAVKLAGLFADVITGSVKLQIKLNGVNVGPLLTIGQIAAWTPLGDIDLVHGDKIGAVMSNQTGSPTTLSATIALDWLSY